MLHPEIGVIGIVWGTVHGSAQSSLTLGTFCYGRCQCHTWNEVMLITKPGRPCSDVPGPVTSTTGKGMTAPWRIQLGQREGNSGLGRVRVRQCSTTVDRIWVSWAQGVLFWLPVLSSEAQLQNCEPQAARNRDFLLKAGIFPATESALTPLVTVCSANPGCLIGFIMAIGNINVFTDLLWKLFCVFFSS